MRSNGRLNLGARKIDSAVERFENLDGFDARIGAPQRSLTCRIYGILVGQVFNRVAQDFQSPGTLAGELPANEWGGFPEQA